MFTPSMCNNNEQSGQLLGFRPDVGELQTYK